MCDLTEEDEAKLPLPQGWIRMIKIQSVNGGSLDNVRVYKEVKTGLESYEHPLILQAQSAVSKKTLPRGWEMMETVLEDGSKDIYYYNPSTGQSMWDSPLLRDALADRIRTMGHDPVALGLCSAYSYHNAPKEQYEESVTNEEEIPLGIAGDGDSTTSVDQDHHRGDLGSGIHPLQVPASSEENDLYMPDVSSNKLHMEELELGFESRKRCDDASDVSDPSKAVSIHGDRPNGVHDDHQSETVQSLLSNRRDWEALLDTYVDKGQEYRDKVSHRIQQECPPVSMTGIAVLRGDVTEANERVHQLIIKLRSSLAAKAGVECSFVYHDHQGQRDHIHYMRGGEGGQLGPNWSGFAPAAEGQHDDNEAGYNSVTLASDIVTTLRQKPEYVVAAMADNNKLHGNVMTQIGFTALHRLLYPMSADTSMTTALLLQGINYQLDEMAAVEQLFSGVDSRLIISRALFVCDPEIALHWDPLHSPLPCVPQVPSETALACLLRLYAVRRDVTVYFRTIWRPVLPSVLALLNANSLAKFRVVAANGGGEGVSLLSLNNVLAVANRLLECTLNEKAIVVFPATATAVCRAVYEIGGRPAMYTYFFQLLVLPNLLKVLAGDHESVENEDLYRLGAVDEVVNKYFDTSFWFFGDELDAEQQQASLRMNGDPALDPLRLLIWTVWRLFSCAAFMDDSALTVLSTKQFFSSAWPAPAPAALAATKDFRVRNMVDRVRRKLERGCVDWLLQMPLDAQGSEYLGLEDELDQIAQDPRRLELLQSNPEVAQLLDHRLSTLHFKPNEMLNLSVVSRHEVDILFSDVASAMEARGHTEDSALYRAVSQYLQISDDCLNAESLAAGAADTSSTATGRQGVEARVGAADGREQLMQLTFLYSSDSLDEYYDSITDKRELGRRKGVDAWSSSAEAKAAPGGARSDTNARREQQQAEEEEEQEEEMQFQELLQRKNEYIVVRHEQLVRGLRLANRYEDSLLRLLRRVEAGAVSSLHELVEDKESWFSAPEFDAAIKHSTVEIASKHTAASMSKLKKPHHGLELAQEISLFPLHSQQSAVDHHPDIKSMAALQDDVIRSFRFGATNPGLAAGTSIARPQPRVAAPVVPRGAVSVTTGADTRAAASRHPRNRRARYTEVQLRPDSNLLAPTQSLIHYNCAKPIPSNPQQIDKQWMTTMRQHEVIPTDVFRMKYRQRQLHRRQQQREQLHQQHQHHNNSYDSMDPHHGSGKALTGAPSSSSRSQPGHQQLPTPHSRLHHHHAPRPSAQAPQASIYRSASSFGGPSPLPFPAHLRHLIRSDDEGDGVHGRQQDQPPARYMPPHSPTRSDDVSFDSPEIGSPQREYNSFANSPPYSALRPPAAAAPGTYKGGHLQQAPEADDARSAQALASEILRDYQTVFAPVAAKPAVPAAAEAPLAGHPMPTGDISPIYPATSSAARQILPRSPPSSAVAPVTQRNLKTEHPPHIQRQPASNQQQQPQQPQRVRSPGLPDPFLRDDEADDDGQGVGAAAGRGEPRHFLAPTRSLLQRLAQQGTHMQGGASGSFQGEVGFGATPALRQHPRTSGFIAAAPFSPTKNKIYPPSGPRVRQVPEFLYKEGSSEGTRSRPTSRPNSRSGTPTRGRSRSNSGEARGNHSNNFSQLSRSPPRRDEGRGAGADGVGQRRSAAPVPASEAAAAEGDVNHETNVSIASTQQEEIEAAAARAAAKYQPNQHRPAATHEPAGLSIPTNFDKVAEPATSAYAISFDSPNPESGPTTSGGGGSSSAEQAADSPNRYDAGADRREAYERYLRSLHTGDTDDEQEADGAQARCIGERPWPRSQQQQQQQQGYRPEEGNADATAGEKPKRSTTLVSKKSAIFDEKELIQVLKDGFESTKVSFQYLSDNSFFSNHFKIKSNFFHCLLCAGLAFTAREIRCA